MNRLQFLIGQVAASRLYTLDLIDDVDEAQWFDPGPGGVSHIGWQVGHLAYAQYRLVLERIRGRRDDDSRWIDPAYQALFGVASVPRADPATYPTPAELRAGLDRVHARALHELADLTDDRLDEPPELPHHVHRTKLEVLAWAARHEMLHAGQIGLIRRQLGHPPLR